MVDGRAAAGNGRRGGAERDRHRLILRIVRGDVAPGGLQRLVDGFVRGYSPIARATPGLIRFHVGIGRMPLETELVVVTFWTSVDAALDAYDGDLASPRTLDGLAAHAEFRDVAYWEVDETLLRRSDRAPALLRLTFGCVSEGADAAIQQELRHRLHLLEGAMTEAYIGRRLVGTEVEIAFVSAWAEVPAQDLSAPVWPDISARYTSFDLGLYRPILSGTPGAPPEPAEPGAPGEAPEPSERAEPG
jgi:hypothetical protein